MKNVIDRCSVSTISKVTIVDDEKVHAFNYTDNYVNLGQIH